MEFKNTKEICELFDISPQHLCYLKKNGLPYIYISTRTHRYVLSDILIWLKTNDINGKPHGIKKTGSRGSNKRTKRRTV